MKGEALCGEIGGIYFRGTRNFGETIGICMRRGEFEVKQVEFNLGELGILGKPKEFV